jgi:arsenate reductase
VLQGRNTLRLCTPGVDQHMNQTILFLCPHNAAKSVIAAAYFNQLACEKGLAFVGNSAGTEPSDTVSAVVVTMMKAEGLDVSQFKTHVEQLAAELAKAE